MKDIVAVHFQPFNGNSSAEFMKEIPEKERIAEDLSGIYFSSKMEPKKRLLFFLTVLVSCKK